MLRLWMLDVALVLVCIVKGHVQTGKLKYAVGIHKLRKFGLYFMVTRQTNNGYLMLKTTDRFE